MGRHKPYQRSWLLWFYHERLRTLRIRPSAFLQCTAWCRTRCILCRGSAGRYYLLQRPRSHLHRRRCNRTRKQWARRYQDQQQRSVYHDSCGKTCGLKKNYIVRIFRSRERKIPGSFAFCLKLSAFALKLWYTKAHRRYKGVLTNRRSVCPFAC